MNTHCDECGRQADGFVPSTECCNGRPCHGHGSARFGTPEVNVRACCWGVAEAEYERRGIAIPDGAYRLS